MPYIQLKTTNEQHKEIKLKAIEAGLTIPTYMLHCYNCKQEQPTPSNINPTEIIPCKIPSKLDTNIKGSSENIEFTNKGLIKKSPSNKPKQKTKKCTTEFIPKLKEYGKNTPVDHTITTDSSAHADNCPCMMCKPPKPPKK